MSEEKDELEDFASDADELFGKQVKAPVLEDVGGGEIHLHPQEPAQAPKPAIVPALDQYESKPTPQEEIGLDPKVVTKICNLFMNAYSVRQISASLINAGHDLSEERVSKILRTKEFNAQSIAQQKDREY